MLFGIVVRGFWVDFRKTLGASRLEGFWGVRFESTFDLIGDLFLGHCWSQFGIEFEACLICLFALV